MISLDVQDYCHECPKFEPECTKFYYGDGNCTTLISCENKGVCANIKLYIEKQMIKDIYDNPTLGKIIKELENGQSGKKA